MRISKTWVVAAAMLALAGTAQAALVNRGGGMIYDTTLKITWLADWNYAKTSGVDADGRMVWANANSWANNLVYGGFDDWRLPTSLNADGTGPCGNFNCAGSEMGHMFYTNWGAAAGSSFSTGSNADNLALFTNVQDSDYWSSTESAVLLGSAWDFFMLTGAQREVSEASELYAVAVRTGDVAAYVPEPQTLALVLLALGATAMVGKRRAGTASLSNV